MNSVVEVKNVVSVRAESNGLIPEPAEFTAAHVFSVQYHPESSPGPQDSGHLFDRFIRMTEACNA